MGDDHSQCLEIDNDGLEPDKESDRVWDAQRRVQGPALNTRAPLYESSSKHRQVLEMTRADDHKWRPSGHLKSRTGMLSSCTKCCLSACKYRWRLLPWQ